MSTDKHTPGPWIQLVSIGDWPVDETYREILAGNGYFNKDAANAGFHLTGYIAEADAALIAAAPALKEENEALKTRVAELEEKNMSLGVDIDAENARLREALESVIRHGLIEQDGYESVLRKIIEALKTPISDDRFSLAYKVIKRLQRELKNTARLQSENELLQKDLNLVIVDEFRKEHVELRTKNKLLREEVESCILELQEHEDEISAASVKSRLERAIAK